MEFRNKSVFITGGSRGIGKAIALKLAAAGADIAIASKTTTPHPRLEGTIYTAAEEIDKAGPGKVLALPLDIRDEHASAEMAAKAAGLFGGIDILVNNASAIHLSSFEQTPPKRYDLMQDINVRGTFFVTQACLPFLKRSSNAHILNLSPPLNPDSKWFSGQLAYTISKYGMSMIVLGLSEELRPHRIAVNALWPRTLIATAAIQNLPGGTALLQGSRTPQILADAAFYLFQQPSAECTGNFFTDEELLKRSGVTDFTSYAVVAGADLHPDFFL